MSIHKPIHESIQLPNADQTNETGGMMSEQPLPCPFCGGNPKLQDFAGWEVNCECGVNLTLLSPDLEELVRAWNTRAKPANVNDAEILAIAIGGGHIDCIFDYSPKIDGQSVLDYEILRLARALLAQTNAIPTQGTAKQEE